MERKKLELKPNEKIILELLFDNPIEGESQYGHLKSTKHLRINPEEQNFR